MSLIRYCIDKLFSSITLFGTPFVYGLFLLYMLRINLSFALTFALLFIIGEMVCTLVKLAYRKDRPIPRKRRMALHEIYDAGSFPSIHTERITLLVIALNVLHAGDAVFFACSLAVWGLVTYSRMYLKEHFFIDVIGGAVIGGMLGYGYFLL
ncbi:TPA: phosphatase PAP2 family protein [Candidatus Woesearchaeota archaeon]|nr:phosphatase PAP2 family protein [Candidatus Woesearchaeota archaeon]